MDDPDLPQDKVNAFHAELARLGRMLGNNQFVIDLLRAKPPRSVLDIGCGRGALLAEIRKKLGCQVIGVDLRPDSANHYGITIVAGDAARDSLPASDIALCVLTVHHLSENQVVELVQNVGRSCERLVIMDLVRHPLPLALFSVFLRPFVGPVVFADGQQSIRRAYTPEELRALVVRGISGTGSTFTQWVSPIYGKQVIDISYRA